MTKRTRALIALDQQLLRYGVYDYRGQDQETREQQYLADSVREFMETNPTVNQIEILEAILHAGLLAACQTTTTNIRMSKELGMRR